MLDAMKANESVATPSGDEKTSCLSPLVPERVSYRKFRGVQQWTWAMGIFFLSLMFVMRVLTWLSGSVMVLIRVFKGVPVTNQDFVFTHLDYIALVIACITVIKSRNILQVLGLFK